MAESPAHKREVGRLLAWMRTQGVRATHATGRSDLPDAPAQGRHEPDVIGTRAGTAWLGEAKTGAGDLHTRHTYEQLYDFSHRYMTATGAQCPFVLCVPPGAAPEAFKALRRAGADMSVTTVLS